MFLCLESLSISYRCIVLPPPPPPPPHTHLSSFLLRICVYICLFFDFPFFFWRVSCEKVFPLFLILIFALGAKVSKCISESFGRSGYIPCRIGKDGGFIRRDSSFHLPRINIATRDRYPLVKIHACVGVHRVTDLEQFSVRISKDEASFDCYLSGRCKRKTTTLWSAALRIPRLHIRVAFSLWTD